MKTATNRKKILNYFAGTERLASAIGNGGLADIGIVGSDGLIDKRMERDSLLRRVMEPYPLRINRNRLDTLYAMTQPDTTAELTYFFHPDHLGSASWITDLSGQPMQHLQYKPFGGDHVDQQSPGTDYSERFRFTGKERDAETGYDYFGARYYSSSLGIWLSVDPMSDKYPSLSPYVYCADNPMRLVDPNGGETAPIYDTHGSFLGTDDHGLQGEAIIMERENFKQNMSHSDALILGRTLDNMSDEEALSFANNGNFMRFLNHYNNLPNRPDWDGYLTLSEANDWYRNGNGEPLFVDLNKIDLSNLFSKGERFVGEHKYISLFKASNNLNDALVYGTIGLTRYPNNQVRGSYDDYDFDMHKGNGVKIWLRNKATQIGAKVAGEGTTYRIYFNGSKTLTPLWPWTK